MHILIVDDEALARQRIERMLEKLDGYNVVGEAANGEQALVAVELLDPDLVLMDVKMPGIDGLQAAQKISELHEPPAIIFCTAYDSYALQAFDTLAVGYLLKPVKDEQLRQALEKARRINKLQRAVVNEKTVGNLDKRKNISAKTHKGIELIPLSEIHCFVADQKYVTVHHQGGETLIDDTLKELEDELSPEFMRVHRNALVAVRDISGLVRAEPGQFEIVLKGADVRPMVSRRHLSSVKALVNSL